MWLVMNKGRWFESWKKIVLTIINLVILGIACAIVCLTYPYMMKIRANKYVQCGLGLYVSGKSIHDSSSSATWTCANNAT